MRVCLTCGIEIDTLTDIFFEKDPAIDLLAIGFGACMPIDYVAEIMSASDYLVNVSNLSKKLDCTVVLGIDTVLYSVKYKSAAVFNSGRLLNVSDMVDARSGYAQGNAFNVYKTKAGKIGVVVDNDIFLCPTHSLCVAGSEVVVNLCDGNYTSGLELLLKREAYGRCPVLSVASDFAVSVTTSGEISHEGSGLLFFVI